jgi:hypothetical protein
MDLREKVTTMELCCEYTRLFNFFDLCPYQFAAHSLTQKPDEMTYEHSVRCMFEFELGGEEFGAIAQKAIWSSKNLRLRLGDQYCVIRRYKMIGFHRYEGYVIAVLEMEDNEYGALREIYSTQPG